MSDDLPFSRYSEPYLNPFPDPHPKEPRPREEREAEKKEEFTPPFVPYSGGREEKKSPELSESSESQKSVETSSVPIIVPQAEEEFDEEFNEDVLKLGIKVVVFIVFVVAIGFLFWFFMKGEKPATEPFAPIVVEEKVISYTDDEGKVVEIIVPSGALKEDIKIEVKKIANGAVTNKYQFTPKGLKFLRPVTIKIPYKENGFKKGETPRDIKLEYQSAPGAQKYLLWYEVDGEAKKLITQVMGF